MSLTNRQEPGLSIKQSIYPVYYASTSTDYIYSDFKYLYKLYTVDGLISTTKNPPYISGGVGVYNPNKYINNLFSLDFSPEITNFTKCDNSILNYRVVVEEQSSDTPSPDTHNFIKTLSLNTSKEDFLFTDYCMYDGSGKFLTNWSSRRKFSLTGEYGTLRFLSGNIFYPFIGTPNSKVRQIKIEILRDDIIYHYLSVDVNPYYTETSLGLDTDNTVLEDVSKFLLEYPCSPEILNQRYWSLLGTTVAGVYYPAPFTIVSDILEEGDKYSFYTYTTPYGTTSEAQLFEVDSSCSRFNNIQLQWENELGGFDFYTFRKVSVKTEKTKPSTYRKVQDTLTEYQMGHNSYARGEEVFHQEIETQWLLNTDWILEEELNEFRDLWISKNVFVYIDGSWFPVISLSPSNVIETDRKGLKSQQISIRLSNKKYN